MSGEQIVVPAHAGFFLHQWSVDGDGKWIHDKWAIVAWAIGSATKYTLPIIGGITDVELTNIPEDDCHLAIEHPDGTFAAHTGYTFRNFAEWEAAAREGNDA